MADNAKILIVDDEQDLREILEFNLSSEGFDIDTASSAEDALEKDLMQYDLLLLDVMMGGMSGYKMADLLRKEKKINTPIIFLTAKSAENDLLTGFNVGGDDYINKPFSVKEVVVRIRAILKRSQANQEEERGTKLSFERLELDNERKSVMVDGQEMKLTRKEFDILFLLLKNKTKFISRQEILNRIWSDDVIVTDRNVDVNIARMRKKIGKYGAHIIGRSGYGYCFSV